MVYQATKNPSLVKTMKYQIQGMFQPDRWQLWGHVGRIGALVKVFLPICKKALKLTKISNITTQYNNIYVIILQSLEN